MKKKMKGMLAVLIAVSLILGITACGKGGGIGGNDPKSLAKETYQIFAKAMETQGQKPGIITFTLWSMTNPPEVEKLAVKVEALSEKDQKAYEEELIKLVEAAEKKSGGK